MRRPRKTRQVEHRGWSSVASAGVDEDERHMPGSLPKRVSNHAFERFAERWLGLRYVDMLIKERDDLNVTLRGLVSAAAFVEHEDGTHQEIWRCPNGMLIVVLHDLVKTVLPPNTEKQNGKWRPKKVSNGG